MRRTLGITALLATSVIASTGAIVGTAEVALALPAGFTDTAVSSPGGNPLSQPTTLVALPDTRALILEKGGKVRVLQTNGTIAAADALSLSVCTGSEMGLLGAAADPDFALNGYVYLYYTTGSNCSSNTGRFNRVSRFVMFGNTIDSGSETILLSNISAYGGNHDGGALEVGQDGYLYVGIGDAGTNPRAPHGSGAANTAATDLSLLNGKMVRITTTGGVPSDNPFVGDSRGVSCALSGTSTSPGSVCLEIYSWGLRNPYRAAFDPNAGSTRFFINDVGQDTWEEVNEGGAGRNYGWNAREGACQTGSRSSCPAPPVGVTDPLTSYAHDGVCEYITAGAFVPNGVWPSQFDGAYLFADGGCGKIWQRNAAGAVDYSSPFASTTGGIVDMEFITQGADPALYYVTVGGSQLRKITYDAPAAASTSALAFSANSAPMRAYDTRFAIGVPVGRMRGATTRLVNLGLNDPSAKAALVNLTLVDSVGEGFVVAYEPRTELPPTSNINALSGETVANSSIVPVDSAGNILVYSSATVDLVVDVMGVFRETTPTTAGGRYQTLSPRRLIDTRIAPNQSDNRYVSTASGPTTDISVPVANLAGVPSNALAVAVILTALSPGEAVGGFATIYPGTSILPTSSNINISGALDTRANLAIVPLGTDGSVKLRLVNVANAIIDVAGYVESGDSATGMYRLIVPSRQVDTRTPVGFGPLGVLATATLNPGGAVPDTAMAISQNLTMTQTGAGGFITAFPGDEVRPVASNLNATGPNQTRAALAITKVGGNGAGSISYFSAQGTHFIVDITGYFQR